MAFSFGASTPTTGFGATGSSLFGPGATSTTPAPSLFGPGATSTSTGSSLFAPGATSTAPPTGGLFGTTTPATGPATTSSSLFGAAPTPSLFGSTPSPFGTTSATTSTTPSLFGGSTSTSLFPTTGNTFSTPTTANNIPGVNWDTMYAALPDNFKKEMEAIQKKISEEKDVIEYMTSRKSEPSLRVKDEAEILTEKLHTLLNTLETDIVVVNNFKKEVLVELRNAESAARSIERFKSPMLMSQYQSYPPSSSYFHQIVHTFEKRMQQYRQLIEELEKFMSVGEQRSYSPKMLQDIMRNQHQFFVTLAAQIATLHDTVEEIRLSYLTFRKKYFNDSFDPFEDADRRQKKKEMLDLTKKLRPNETPTLALPAPAPATTPATTGSNPLASTSTPSTNLFSSISLPTTTTTTAASTSLFGTTANTPSTTGTSLFGTTTAAPVATPSTSLFGVSPSPTTTTVNFGSTAPLATSFSNVTSTPSSGSLFVADSSKRPPSSKGTGRKR